MAKITAYIPEPEQLSMSVDNQRQILEAVTTIKESIKLWIFKKI